MWISSHQAITVHTAGITGVEGRVIHTPAYPACSVSCLTESSDRKLLSGLILPNTVLRGLCPRLCTPTPPPEASRIPPRHPHPM